MSGPLRSMMPIIAILVVLVIVAVVVALIAAPDEAERLPEDSPEGVVQRYLQALDDRDFDTAYEMLSEGAQERSSPEELRTMVRFNLDDDPRRIRLIDVDISDDRALVRIEIERTTGSGLDFSRITTRRSIPLVLENGEWKIDDPVTGIL